MAKRLTERIQEAVFRFGGISRGITDADSMGWSMGRGGLSPLRAWGEIF